MCPALKISFYDASHLSFKEIKEKYLKEILPMARGIMRKDARLAHGAVVSDEVPDEFLDDILALRWKENSKLWLLAMGDMGK